MERYKGETMSLMMERKKRDPVPEIKETLYLIMTRDEKTSL